MTSDDYRNFVAIVAGNNPEMLMAPYDAMKEVEPYVVYKRADAELLRQKYIEMYEAILKNNDISEEEKAALQIEYDNVKDEGPIEFYYEITDGMEYDEETGDAISTENKLGKWRHFQLGKNFSVPFLKKDGSEAYQAIKSEIDWPQIHLNNSKVYERAWEMVIEGDKPNDETEELIYTNMKNRTAYFNKFGTKENYVVSSTAFWGYAFLSEKTGWVELEDDIDQFTWVSNFFDRFIKPLPEGTKLTIFECKK